MSCFFLFFTVYLLIQFKKFKCQLVYERYVTGTYKICSVHLVYYILCYAVDILQQQYYDKFKFFLCKAIYIKGLKPFRVNQRCYPYIKIRKNRFFATLKNIKIKTKKHPFYRGAFFINSNQYLLFLKLFFA